MNTTEEKQMELTMDKAIESWYAARHRFQIQSSTENMLGYNESTDLLAQALKRDYAEGPEAQAAFEEFRRGLVALGEGGPKR